jgi:flagellar hook-length control protein FliK
MDIGVLIPSAGPSTAPQRLGLLVEGGQCTQSAEGETFSTLLKGLAQNAPDKEVPLPSESDDPTGSISSSNNGEPAIMASTKGVALATNAIPEDLDAASPDEAAGAESTQNAQASSPQGFEVSPLVLQNTRVIQTHDLVPTVQDGATSSEMALPRTADLPNSRPLQPLADPGQAGEAPGKDMKQTASRTTDESPIRNGRGAPADTAPASLDRRSGDSALLSPSPPGSLISDRSPSSVMENEGTKNVRPAVSVDGGGQSLDRPSTGTQLSTIVQEQRTEGTTLPGQSLLVSVSGASGGSEQDLSGADAQGAGEGAFLQSGQSGAPESVTRGNQPQLFSGQFTSTQQAQLSPQGGQASVATPASDHLKMTQTLLGDDHPATMTSVSGKAQVVHLELPPHESGPLGVRISMTDQTVHTQFTTDRSDLGALLLTRQDQLQQSLTKSGLELGQFQVHIDQQGRQEAFPDRQSRRNGEALEQQSSSQAQDQEAHNRDRPDHRPSRTLSLFA